MTDQPQRGRPRKDAALAAAHIHLRVTPERKSAYVRAAQASGQSLSDWMVVACDAASNHNFHNQKITEPG